MNKPWRSEKYKRWVKSQPCVGCGHMADDPHHIIDVGMGAGMGTKPDDFLSIPLCRGCHTRLHENVKVWEHINGLQFVHLCRTLQRAFREGVCGEQQR